MAIVHGQLETLQRIQQALCEIDNIPINSVEDLKQLEQKLRTELRSHFRILRAELQEEIEQLASRQLGLEETLHSKTALYRKQLQSELAAKRAALQALVEPEGLLPRFLYHLNKLRLTLTSGKLEQNMDRMVAAHLKELNDQVQKGQEDLETKRTNKNALVEQAINEKYPKKVKLLRTIESLSTTIVGAIGEEKVMQTLSHLPDDYLLINNFRLSFHPPIYHKAEKSGISSVQVDHLLIGTAGVFLIETKNWSRESVERLDFRSPIAQIQRSGYAIFTLLNSQQSGLRPLLEKHHWGAKSIPVRNVIALNHHKPQGRFQHVQIKTLKELNPYFLNQQPVLTTKEVAQVQHFLLKCMV